jgi:hypothetical protein
MSRLLPALKKKILYIIYKSDKVNVYAIYVESMEYNFMIVMNHVHDKNASTSESHT